MAQTPPAPPPDLGHFFLGPSHPPPPDPGLRQTSAALKYSGMLFAAIGVCLIVRFLEVRRNRILAEMYEASQNAQSMAEATRADVEDGVVKDDVENGKKRRKPKSSRARRRDQLDRQPLVDTDAPDQSAETDSIELESCGSVRQSGAQQRSVPSPSDGSADDSANDDLRGGDEDVPSGAVLRALQARQERSAAFNASKPRDTSDRQGRSHNPKKKTFKGQRHDTSSGHEADPVQPSSTSGVDIDMD
jgi:hypothetical protein